MKKFLLFVIVMVIVMVMASGCSWFTKKPEEPIVSKTDVSVYLPAASYEDYCNGEKMDSEGYKKTLTDKETITIDKANLTPKQLMTETLVAAANNAGYYITNNIDEKYFKVIGDTAYIQPIEGWAGVSIFLCYWKPLIEVNLMQFPEIKKVEWVTDEAQWTNLQE